MFSGRLIEACKLGDRAEHPWQIEMQQASWLKHGNPVAVEAFKAIRVLQASDGNVFVTTYTGETEEQVTKVEKAKKVSIGGWDPRHL